MTPSNRIFAQRQKLLQEVMQTNPSKDITRNTLVDILLSRMPKGTKSIHSITNGGAGASAFQFEAKLAYHFPRSHFDSIENKRSKITETDERVDNLNSKYRDSFFQILYGNNGSLDRIKGLNLELGWTLMWADGLSRFGKQHINWMKQVKKLLKKEMRVSKLSSPRFLCLTLALKGQGPKSPYHLLKREYKNWKNNPSSIELAQNVIQGAHAYFNSLLASTKVHLKPLHAELYRGEDSKTHMAFMVWEVQTGKFQGQMFDRIINRIHEHILKTGHKYMVREKAVRKSKTKQTPHTYYPSIKKLLDGKLKGYGMKYKKRSNFLTSNWTPNYTGEEFYNQCQNVYKQVPVCII